LGEAREIHEALLASPDANWFTRQRPLWELAAISTLEGDVEGGRNYVERLFATMPDANVSFIRGE
ncbi:MAG: hypothetical protein QF449_03850, partial [Alphaproteobacteria bacterium]|nr:hypothetical protein [Alphaproteobacteria bacterium]